MKAKDFDAKFESGEDITKHLNLVKARRLVAEKEVEGSPVRRVLGCLKTRKRTDELIKDLRGCHESEISHI